MASGLILACLLATSPEHSAGQIRSRLWEATRNGTANNGKLRQSSSFDLINLIKDREAQDTRPTPSPQDEAKAAAARKAVQEAEQLANTLKDLPRAIAKFEEALALYKSIKDDRGEVAALTGIAASHNAQGDKKRALDVYREALSIYLRVGDKSGEAATLNNMGSLYQDIGDLGGALESYDHALTLWRVTGDRAGEATILNNIGSVYSSLGETQKALQFYYQALPILRAVGDHNDEARTVNNVGRVYDSLGDKQKALDFYNQALLLWRAVGDISGEASTLNNIGVVYDSLGEREKALDYYNQALPILRAIDDRGGEARTLNNLGRVYDSLGKGQAALAIYNQSLKLWTATGDRNGQATTLENLSGLYAAQGDKQKASDLYAQAVAVRNVARDRKPTLHILSIGIDRYPFGPETVTPGLKYPLWNLTTAVKDARDFASTLEASAGDFEQVKTHLLDTNCTKARILEEFEKIIRDVKPADTFVFSYSGQGYSAKVGHSEKREFYLMPADFSARVGAPSAISTALLLAFFTKIQAQRRFIVIDARESSAGFDYLSSSIAEESRSLAGLLRRDVALVALSEGPRINLVEGEGQGNGLLTYALLKGMKSPADGKGVSVREVMEYARSYVKRRLPTIPNLDRYQRHVEVKSFMAGEDFPLTRGLSNQIKTSRAHHSSPAWIIGTSRVSTGFIQDESQNRSSQKIAGRTDTALSRAPRERMGKDYALLIATNTYDQFHSLENPVADALAIKKALEDGYGFKAELIPNPRADDIYAALRRYKNEIKYADDDQLFLFFAGHGTYNEDFREGYVIAKDSLKDDPNTKSYLPYSKLKNIIDQIPCRHIFLVVDACFGGTFDEWIARGRGERHHQHATATNLEFIDRKMRHQTRLFLTSGGKAYVPDGERGGHSPFAGKLLEALKSQGENGILTFYDILSRIKRVTPEPVNGTWGENDPRSDFLFIDKKTKPEGTKSSIRQRGSLRSTRSTNYYFATPQQQHFFVLEFTLTKDMLERLAV